jgi:iron complex outermembrane recepter protein
MSIRGFGTAFAATLALAATAQAQNVTGSQMTLQPLETTAKRPNGQMQPESTPFTSAVPDHVPASIEERTRVQLDETNNAVTVMELMKYFPSVEVRERYIGDRNGIMATRTTGTISSAESMVYEDGILLSNFLGNSYSFPPRWDFVPMATIQKIDMMYGPFSALYPGNSLGGVATITTRMPDKLEAHVEATVSNEFFDLYKVHENNTVGHVAATVGDRIGGFSWWLNWDHLQGNGHPMSFDTVATSGATKTAGTPVSGAVPYVDSNGKPAYLFGAYSIDTFMQDSAVLKVAYDFDNEHRLSLQIGAWSNISATSTQTFVNSLATGAPIYNGTVNVGGQNFALAGLNPTRSFQTHLATAVEYKTDTHGKWDGDFIYTSYTFLQDQTLASTNYGINNAGTNTAQDGTGWQTIDARGIYRPDTRLLGSHEISFGVHYDVYRLNQHVFNDSVWNSPNTTSLNSSSNGFTETSALYLQDFWKINDTWSVTLGLRGEAWEAFGGNNTNSKGSISYPTRTFNALSPKVSVAYQIDPTTDIRLSFGEAYRFPTVNELFQSLTNSTTGIYVNDPALKPEVVLSSELTLDKTIKTSTMRISFFDEERHNALFAQTSVTAAGTVTANANIPQVRTYGIEASDETHDIFFPGLDFNGSITWSPSTILSDSLLSGAQGKIYPRIPLWRARATLVYHLNNDWVFSAGVRAASASYSTLLNTDINHQVYGAISAYLVGDVRVTHKIRDGITLVAGVDNIGDFKYYVSPHPYPQTTAFLTVKWDL